MIEQQEGWYVVNVKDARWMGSPAFGSVCMFEKADERFPQTGVHLFVLEPGKPNCRYHRESVQEDCLVLSGHCKLLVNGEEKQLGPWDFVHFPAGVTHVLVGEGEAPCAVLFIGHRSKDVELFYPESELARRHGAEAPEPTPNPGVAYSDVGPREERQPPEWPV
jgi:uncharacterized cupin superfamily protein